MLQLRLEEEDSSDGLVAKLSVGQVGTCTSTFLLYFKYLFLTVYFT